MFIHAIKNKKAIMGVSTLIIFITAILVAAVAASVIVRTVGILQERAFTVGTEVRDRLVTLLDFVSITSYNNQTEEVAYGVTILVRTRAGSYAYDLATAGLLFTSDQGTYTAELQHTDNEDLGLEINRVL
jgi:archaellin